MKVQLKKGEEKKNSGEKGEHNKYSDDIIIRKIKTTLFKNLIIFINIIIKEFYHDNIGLGENQKKLLNLNSDQINTNTLENKSLLKKKVKDILSGDISGRYSDSKYEKSFNKNLIKNLLKEEDEKKRIVFEKIFNLIFLDVLEHFRGSKIIPELNRMNTLKDVEFKNSSDYEEYKTSFVNFVNDFEKKIDGKKERKSKKIKIN